MTDRALASETTEPLGDAAEIARLMGLPSWRKMSSLSLIDQIEAGFRAALLGSRRGCRAPGRSVSSEPPRQVDVTPAAGPISLGIARRLARFPEQLRVNLRSHVLRLSERRCPLLPCGHQVPIRVSLRH